MRQYGDMLSQWLQAVAARFGVDPVLFIYAIAGTITAVTLSIIIWSIVRLVRPEPIKAEASGQPVLVSGSDEEPDDELPAPRLSLESPFRSQDSLLPRSGVAYLAFVALVSALLWGLGFVLASDRARLIAAPEWRWQPFYLAIHFIVLRLFLNAYMLNYRQGVHHFDMDPEQAVMGLRKATGWFGRIAAVVIAAPFALLDYRYMTSGRYDTLAGAGKVETADLIMWGIWSLEWLINAFIWIVVIGFAVKNAWVIRRFNFKAPIETVVHAKHYRPFLRMSGQGATILFGFALATIVYIALTGGELQDYLGLFLTMVLVVISFFVPFTLLRAKVAREMRRETWRLRQAVTQALGPTAAAGGALGVSTQAIPQTIEGVNQRLDNALILLRLQHLDQIRVDLGGTEARQLAVRIAAPFITIAWNQRVRLMELFQKIVDYLQAFALR
ncbi:MAG: hypothetical protein RL291_589 [Pseudomonadota bacterium]